MSRGKECADFDETVGLWIIGQAVNYAALDEMDRTGSTYEQARNSVAEGFAFALAELYKKHYQR
jgi:hypothetical protein